MIASPALAEPLHLQESHSQTLIGHFEVLSDPTGNLSFDDILLSPGLAHKFRPIPGILNLSYTKDTLWVRFVLRRSANFPEYSYFQLSPPILDYLTLYVQKDDDPKKKASYKEYQLGDHLPVSMRPVLHPDFVVPLDLPADRDTVIYVRLVSSSVLNLAAEIHPPSDFISKTTQAILLQEAWMAMAVLIAMVSLLFYYRLRDPLYGYYGLYILAMCVSRISAAGLLPLVVPSYAHLLADHFISVGSCLTLVFLILFGIRLFSSVITLRINRLLNLILFAAVVATLCIPFIRWGNIALPLVILMLITYAIYSWLSLTLAQQGEDNGWLYFFSFATFVIVCFLMLLRVTGIIDMAWWNVNSFQIGSLIHIFLLVMALAERLYFIEQKALLTERNAKQEAVTMAKEMTIELRNKQKELEQSLERQIRFIALVSHEYRNPLAIIRTNLGLISKLEDDPDGNLSFAITKMKRAVTRLVEVLEISLGKVRLSEDMLIVKRQAFMIIPLLYNIIEQAYDFWPDRQFEFSTDLAREVKIYADPELIKTALLNLLDNAVKYSPEGSLVKMHSARLGDKLVIKVVDQGRGIPPADRNRVFEKYYRCRGIGGTKGSGLGLYLVQRILDEHHGQVEITGNDSNGTTVAIMLPITTILPE